MDYDEIYPIMRTAFGDLILIYNFKGNDDEYEKIRTAVIDVKHHDANKITIGLEDFFESNLLSPGDLMASTNIDPDLFFDTFDKLGVLKYDQCYGFEPILPLGGKEDIKHAKVLNFDIHLDILTQALKEPIDL